MLPRQAIEAERFFDILFHPSAKLGVAFSSLQQPRRKILSCLLSVAAIIDPAQLLKAIIIGFARQVVERIPQEVNVAALPDRLRQRLLNGAAQTGMIVAEDELHSV